MQVSRIEVRWVFGKMGVGVEGKRIMIDRERIRVGPLQTVINRFVTSATGPALSSQVGAKPAPYPA